MLVSDLSLFCCYWSRHWELRGLWIINDATMYEQGHREKNPGPWAEASRALSYRAVTGPYYVDNVDIRGPAGPCRAPKSRRAPAILPPPCPPPSRRACVRVTVKGGVLFCLNESNWTNICLTDVIWRSGCGAAAITKLGDFPFQELMLKIINTSI